MWQKPGLLMQELSKWLQLVRENVISNEPVQKIIFNILTFVLFLVSSISCCILCQNENFSDSCPNTLELKFFCQKSLIFIVVNMQVINGYLKHFSYSGDFILAANMLYHLNCNNLTCRKLTLLKMVFRTLNRLWTFHS